MSRLTAIFGIGTVVIAGIAFAATYNAGFSKGRARADEEISKYQINLQKKEARIKELLSSSSDRIVTKYVDQVKTIKEREYVYITKMDEIVPVQFNLSNSWVLTHDSFIQDRDAPTTGTLDASPSEFTDVEGLKRILGNYAICKQTSEQLKSLQEWIRTSQKEVGVQENGG